MTTPQPIAGPTVAAEADARVVTVVGATGHLGGYIVEALIKRGVHVRAMVRATSNRTSLEALGVTDFVVGDLNDAASLQSAMRAEPRAAAVIASAAGFSAHSAKTKADNSKADTEGYRNLIDATKAAGAPRFILISILGCDRAPNVPHFRQKFEAEQHLKAIGQPYLSLRAGAFIDRSRDIVPENIAKGVFPDIIPGAPMALLYARDLARYAAIAALDLPASAMNGSVDIGSEAPGTGDKVAAAFTKVLGRPIRAKPVFPAWLTPLLPLVTLFAPRLCDQLIVMRWVRQGGYVSREPHKQKALFGEAPTVEETVARYARDKGLVH
ncbi:MAG: NmrA family NAD(P)-binding protein [Pseudomonadota bacterium]|nr:NmrA family NAD(P)-binding protein [Pseudomonadota bacterium]